MTACTDDERWRVAERLRGLAGGYVTIGEVEEALGVRISPPRVDLDRDARNLSRLADLIEPSCDRDALLALADEIETVNCPDYGEWDMVVRRIREALGVSDD